MELQDAVQDGAGEVGCDLKFMESGWVCLGEQGTQLEVRRGMSFRSAEGVAVGKVAAVAFSGQSRWAVFLLLSRLPELNGYRVVPADLIVGIREESVQLSQSAEAVENLPAWHATG